MQNWELDRIYILVRAACISSKNNQVKFLIDLNDRSLFNLILKNKIEKEEKVLATTLAKLVVIVQKEY